MKTKYNQALSLCSVVKTVFRNEMILRQCVLFYLRGVVIRVFLPLSGMKREIVIDRISGGYHILFNLYLLFAVSHKLQD